MVSVDIVMDLQETGIKDPGVEVIAQHWKAINKILFREEATHVASPLEKTVRPI